MKNKKQEHILKIHRAIRSDYLKSELLVIGLEVIFVFLLLQFITIFIPILQTHIPNTPLRINFTISTSIGIIYSLIRIIVKLKSFKIAKVQPKLAELDELYATTLELTDFDSIPAQATQNEFIENAKKTSTYPLMNYKRLNGRTGLIFVMICLLLITPFIGAVREVDLSWIEEYLPDNGLKEFFVEPDNVTLLSDEGIYGNQTDIVRGDTSLEITLDLTTSGGDYTNPLAWQNDLKSSNNRFSGSVDAQLDNPAIEKLPEEFELAKAYNLKIRQIE